KWASGGSRPSGYFVAPAARARRDYHAAVGLRRPGKLGSSVEPDRLSEFCLPLIEGPKLLRPEFKSAGDMKRIDRTDSES
ncbi:MAG: hypothetical protein ABSD70_19005, partial [Terracidiphilus sp.]